MKHILSYNSLNESESKVDINKFKEMSYHEMLKRNPESEKRDWDMLIEKDIDKLLSNKNVKLTSDDITYIKKTIKPIILLANHNARIIHYRKLIDDPSNFKLETVYTDVLTQCIKPAITSLVRLIREKMSKVDLKIVKGLWVTTWKSTVMDGISLYRISSLHGQLGYETSVKSALVYYAKHNPEVWDKVINNVISVKNEKWRWIGDGFTNITYEVLDEFF